MPKYSAPVAVADVLVVFGTATMNSAAVGNGIGNVAVRDEQYPHCFYQQTARYPKPVKVYRESKTNPVTPTLTLLKWLIECHKNVDPFGSYPVEKAQNVPFTESGKVKLTFL